MKRISLIFVLMLPSWAWAENYLCISDEAAGFRVENEKYKATIFAGGTKYIVSVDNKTVTKHGSGYSFFKNCENYDDSLHCNTSGITILVHKKNLRFMRFNRTYGYAYKNEDQPYIEIGTCTKF